MRILHVNASNISGGAGRAAYRLHTGLRRLGQDSSIFVPRGQINDPSVMVFESPMAMPSRARRFLRRQRINRSFGRYRETRPQGYEPFSDDRTQHGATVTRQLPPCEVVNLHWIAGFLDYSSFFTQVPQTTPVVWTLHDMNAFTGGCHYDDGCSRWMHGCGACPQLGSHDERDLSHQVWARKRAALASGPNDRLRIVTPSRWLAQQARRSPLLRRFSVTVIPNGLDTDIFAPRGRREARPSLGIPLEANVILFVAQSATKRRKGFSLLARALTGLDEVLAPLLISLGKGNPQVGGSLPHLHLGHVKHNRLVALAYNVADLFVIPSLQDNLPNTVLESLACGTPVVGFDVGGIPDMVRPGMTGLLAPVGHVDALREAIQTLLEKPVARTQMSANCRRVAVGEYALEVQARRYVELYREMLDDAHGSG